jgi:dipeptidyl aminopeptidase/acylaminoacyl peptidase
VAVAPVTDLGELKREAEHFTNFENVSRFVGSGPHIADGSPARHAEAFRAPVLLFHGDLDANVGVGESRLMKSRLMVAGKNVTYIEFDGLDHGLDDAAARARVLRDSDAFFRKSLGIP